MPHNWLQSPPSKEQSFVLQYTSQTPFACHVGEHNALVKLAVSEYEHGKSHAFVSFKNEMSLFGKY